MNAKPTNKNNTMPTHTKHNTSIIKTEDNFSGSWWRDNNASGSRYAIEWRIGCGGHYGYHFTNWPRVLIATGAVSSWLGRRIIKFARINIREFDCADAVKRSLWGAWWYESDSPTFRWIRWSLACWYANTPAVDDRRKGRSVHPRT